MRDYSKVSPLFWSGRTGRELRGHRDAQVVAFYLMTCHNANMIGLYYMPLPTLIHEIGSPLQGARKALRSLERLDFAFYDEPSEYVWVPKMAKLQIGESLDRKDKRVLGVIRELENHRNSPFFNEFLDLYREAYWLHDVPKSNVVRKPLASPLEAPCKPLPSQEQEQEQEIGEGSTLKLGEFGLAILSQEEFDRLTEKLNGRRDAYIADFDNWVHEAPEAKTSSGVRRKDRHAYETICSWHSRDVREGKIKTASKPTKVVL